MHVQEKQQVFRIFVPRPPVHQHVQERDQRQEDEHGLRRGADRHMEQVRAIVARDFIAGVLDSRGPVAPEQSDGEGGTVHFVAFRLDVTVAVSNCTTFVARRIART